MVLIVDRKKNTPMIKAYIDGACEPINPCGNMGFGVYIEEDGKEIYSWSGFVPANNENSNNVAEYIALENCLDYLLENGLQDELININTDSMLVCQQMNKRWKIKSGRYYPYAISCFEKVRHFNNLLIKWIPREQNTIADELSKSHIPN